MTPTTPPGIAELREALDEYGRHSVDYGRNLPWSDVEAAESDAQADVAKAKLLAAFEELAALRAEVERLKERRCTHGDCRRVLAPWCTEHRTDVVPRDVHEAERDHLIAETHRWKAAEKKTNDECHALSAKVARLEAALAGIRRHASPDETLAVECDCVTRASCDSAIRAETDAALQTTSTGAKP